MLNTVMSDTSCNAHVTRPGCMQPKAFNLEFHIKHLGDCDLKYQGHTAPSHKDQNNEIASDLQNLWQRIRLKIHSNCCTLSASSLLLSALVYPECCCCTCSVSYPGQASLNCNQDVKVWTVVKEVVSAGADSASKQRHHAPRQALPLCVA